MEKKKALLLLTGGRGLPDMLVVKYLRPDYILNLTTPQGLRDAQNLQVFTRSKFLSDMEILPTINPYSKQAIKDACESALQRIPDAEWVIHFTSSPKVVGIYAYEVARKYNIPYWYLDTGGEQVISVLEDAKEVAVKAEQFFKATVEEYIGAYGRTYEIPKSQDYRRQAESWYNVAQALAHQPEATEFLLKAVRGASSVNIAVDATSTQTEQLLQQLAVLGALTIEERRGIELHCRIKGNEMLEFLKGDWLEVYAWHEAIKAGFADDCQWGYKIVANLPANELDLVLTYKARLLIAECKTSSKPFETDHLYKLHSVADLIGGNYVRQAFVTHRLCPRENDKDFDSFENFRQQAELRRITVITGDKLYDISNILKEEATTSKHPRK